VIRLLDAAAAAAPERRPSGGRRNAPGAFKPPDVRLRRKLLVTNHSDEDALRVWVWRRRAVMAVHFRPTHSCLSHMRERNEVDDENAYTTAK